MTKQKYNNGFWKKLIISIALGICFISSIPSIGVAISINEDPCEGGSCFQSGIDSEKLPEEIKKTGDLKGTIISVINYALTFVGILLLLMVLYAGILMITSNGDDKVIEKAKKMLINATIGIIIIILSYTIVSFLGNIGKEVETPEPTPTINQNNGGSSDTSGLEKSISDLQKQLEELRKAQNPDAEKIANLEKELAALERQMQTTTGSLQKDLENLINQFDALSSNGTLTTSDIIALKRTIEDLKQRSAGNPELESKYNELLILLDQLLENPNDENLLGQIRKTLAELGISIGKASEIMAKFTITASQKSVPTTVSLSAEKTYIRGVLQTPIPNDSYVWSVVGANGQEQIIGNGILQSFTITDSGSYIFRLQVKTPEAGVISGEAKQTFIALPQETNISFLANGKTLNETIAFTQTENTTGIVFTPIINEKTGRTISKYIWHFGGIRAESTEKKSVLYNFPKAGSYSVYLETVDNTGETVKSKTATVSIQEVVAYFSLPKSEFLIDEPITFSGKPSGSDNGSISDFAWKFLNSKGETVSEANGANTIEKFSTPGNHTGILTVKDSKGKSASFYKNFIIVSSNPTAQFIIKQASKDTPATFIFDATGSQDPGNQKLSYAWDFDGDGSFEKTGLTNPTTEYTFSKPGTYSVSLETSNPFRKKTKSSQKLTVLSTLQLKIETSSSATQVQKEMTFTAKHSGAKSFEWNFNDGTGKQITNETSIKHTFSKSGKYLVILTAFDENEQRTSTQKMIFVGESESPTAVIDIILKGNMLEWEENLCGTGKHGIVAYRSDTLTFSAENSVNKNGRAESLTYSWKFPDGINDTIPNVAWKFSKLSEDEKCEEIKLIVKDTRSNTLSKEESIWVSVENKKPKITAFSIGQPKTNIAPVSIPLSIKTNDEDGGIRKYTWWANRVGGDKNEKIGLHGTQKESTMLLIPPFGDEGNVSEYTMHCEVEDNNGGKNTCFEALGDYAPISIKTTQNISPKVQLIPDKRDIKLGDTIVFTATVKTSEGLDISSLANFKWDFDGDNVFDDVSAVNIIAHKYTTAGKFSPRVKVMYQGLSTSVSDKITVQLTSKLPLAKITATRGKNGEVMLDGSNSEMDKSIEGNALQYSWDFNTAEDKDGDGKMDNDIDATGASAKASYAADVKRVRVKLSITDAAGGEDSTSQYITIDSLSGITGSSSEKQKTLQKEQSTISEIVQDIKTLMETQNPAPEKIQAIKDKINTLKSSSVSAKTQSQLATLEGVMQKWEQNPSQATTLLSELEGVEKTIETDEKNTSLLSDEKKKALQDIIKEIEEKANNNTLTETDIKKAEALIKELEGDVQNDPALKKSLEEAQTALAEAKQNISDPSLIQKAIQKLKSFESQSSEDASIGIWKSVSELGEKINRSLSFITKNPSSVLDVYGGERYILNEETVTIFIFAKNADGSFYNGPVEMKLKKGEGVFNKSTLTASSGRAVGEFTPNNIGEIEIEVTAPNIVSGSLSESLYFTVE